MTTQQKSNRIFVTVAAILGSLFLALVVVSVLSLLGRIDGSEFSPDTFAERGFGYSRLPLLHQRITKTSLGAASPCPTSIAQHLNVSLPPTSRWDLSRIHLGATSTSPYPASLLSQAVHEDPSWESWSSDQPKLAAMLWPTLQQLAQQECYFAIPRLLERFRGQTDATGDVSKLQSELDQACAEAAILRADYLRSQNDLDGAYRCLEWGKTHGSHPELEKRLQTWKTSK